MAVWSSCLTYSQVTGRDGVTMDNHVVKFTGQQWSLESNSQCHTHTNP